MVAGMHLGGFGAGTAQTRPAAGAGPGPESPPLRKLENAAQEFEGILLASVWRAWNQSNQMGNPQDKIGSSMTDMGLEMAAIAMAHKGGIGLAKMIVNSLKGEVTGQNRKSS